jgi:hypothetical protein
LKNVTSCHVHLAGATKFKHRVSCIVYHSPDGRVYLRTSAPYFQLLRRIIVGPSTDGCRSTIDIGAGLLQRKPGERPPQSPRSRIPWLLGPRALFGWQKVTYSWTRPTRSLSFSKAAFSLSILYFVGPVRARPLCCACSSKIR